MAGAPVLKTDFDQVKLRKSLGKAAKRLYEYSEQLLLSSQEPLKEKIERRAPSGDSGKLKDGIYVDVVMRPSGPVLKAGVRGVPYAVFQEFGTSFHDAQPFLRPAIAEMPETIQRRTRKKL